MGQEGGGGQVEGKGEIREVAGDGSGIEGWNGSGVTATGQMGGPDS